MLKATSPRRDAGGRLVSLLNGRRRLGCHGLHVVYDCTLDAADPRELRVLAVLSMPVEDGLPVHGDLQDAGLTGGKGDGCLVAYCRKDLSGYPSRLREVASRYAVGDLHIGFAFHDTLLGKVNLRVVWPVWAVNQRKIERGLAASPQRASPRIVAEPGDVPGPVIDCVVSAANRRPSPGLRRAWRPARRGLPALVVAALAAQEAAFLVDHGAGALRAAAPARQRGGRPRR